MFLYCWLALHYNTILFLQTKYTLIDEQDIPLVENYAFEVRTHFLDVLFFKLSVFCWGVGGVDWTNNHLCYDLFRFFLVNYKVFTLTTTKINIFVMVNCFEYYYKVLWNWMPAFTFRRAWKLMQMGMGRKSLLMPLTSARVDGLVDHCMSYSGECTVRAYCSSHCFCTSRSSDIRITIRATSGSLN